VFCQLGLAAALCAFELGDIMAATALLTKPLLLATPLKHRHFDVELAYPAPLVVGTQV
jgi:hypothetical protein